MLPVALDFFLHYAYLILFLWVLTEQLGAPVPSLPLLVAAGTLTATHKLQFPLVIGAVMLACLISDTVWYLLGKRFGGAVVRLVCRLSLEKSTCVRKTEDYFTKYGPQSLLLAKFVPGLGAVAAPIAGQAGMPYRYFLIYDLGGALLWSVAATLGGRIFGDVLKRNPDALDWVSRSAGLLFVLAILVFLAQRIWKQQSFLKRVKMARIDPAELKRMLDAGQKVFIADLRHPLDYLPDPRVLPGAIRYTPDSLVERCSEIPRDRDVILYCTCPSEATAAKVAMKLRQIGIYRVRPLRGGFDQWKKLGFPLEEYREPVATEA